MGKELNRLEVSGVLWKVDHSEWAAPIVSIPKEDEISRDYKVMINPILRVDQYPLPKHAGLMASLTGSKRFSKLDLTAAYQQMPLDDASTKLVAVNTHHGLHEYTRLPFGGASAPTVFQKAMDILLQGVPLDVILVTGK